MDQCDECKNLRKAQKKYPELDAVYGIGLNSLVQKDVAKTSDRAYWNSMLKNNPILYGFLRCIYDFVDDPEATETLIKGADYFGKLVTWHFGNLSEVQKELFFRRQRVVVEQRRETE